MARNKKVTTLGVVENAVIEEKYQDVKSAFNGVADLEIRKLYTLQAKAEAASEEGDTLAEKYFTRQIEAMITNNPPLEKAMTLLEEALTCR